MTWVGRVTTWRSNAKGVRREGARGSAGFFAPLRLWPFAFTGRFMGRQRQSATPTQRGLDPVRVLPDAPRSKPHSWVLWNHPPTSPPVRVQRQQRAAQRACCPGRLASSTLIALAARVPRRLSTVQVTLPAPAAMPTARPPPATQLVESTPTVGLNSSTRSSSVETPLGFAP